jgi:hypothetical protein
MKSMYFQKGNEKLRAVIDLTIPTTAIRKNPNLKTVTIERNMSRKFEYMTEKEFWAYINSSGFESVKEFS